VEVRESPRESISAGIEALNAGDMEEASFLFEHAYSFAGGTVRNEAGFLFVYTLYLLDERNLALEVIGEVAPEPTEPYYPDYAVVAGEILLDADREGEAAELLRASVEERGDIDETQPLTAQATYFLLGRASEAQDNAAWWDGRLRRGETCPRIRSTSCSRSHNPLINWIGTSPRAPRACEPHLTRTRVKIW